MRRNNLVIIWLILLTALSARTDAAPQNEKTVVISGYGTIVGDDRASARTRAISDAYQRAVEQALGTMVEARTLIRNELMIRSEIYSRAEGYIETYRILSEGLDRQQYRVTMQIQVSRQPLNNDLIRLGLVQLLVDNPRLMILYDPSPPRVPALAEFAEQELIHRFTESRFNLVDPTTARALHREAGTLLQLENIENVAARLGLQHNAEVVLVYRLMPAHTGSDGVFEQGRATILARAIVTTTARLLAALTKTASGAAESRKLAVADATTKASREVADYLIARISTWWTDFVKNGIPYTVTLESPPRKRLESKFTNHLGGMAGVVSVHLRACGGKFCEYQVVYRGTTARLQQAVIDTLETERGFERIATKSIRGNYLVFSAE